MHSVQTPGNDKTNIPQIKFKGSLTVPVSTLLLNACTKEKKKRFSRWRFINWKKSKFLCQFTFLPRRTLITCLFSVMGHSSFCNKHNPRILKTSVWVLIQHKRNYTGDHSALGKLILGKSKYSKNQAAGSFPALSIPKRKS